VAQEQAACLHQAAVLAASAGPFRHARANRRSTNCAIDQASFSDDVDSQLGHHQVNVRSRSGWYWRSRGVERLPRFRDSPRLHSSATLAPFRGISVVKQQTTLRRNTGDVLVTMIPAHIAPGVGVTRMELLGGVVIKAADIEH
jgi:hypothetical protein